MPETTERILHSLMLKNVCFESLMSWPVSVRHKVVEKREILFVCLGSKEVMAKVEELHPPVQEEEKKRSPELIFEPKAEITFEDFEKLQFQVGEITFVRQ